MQTEFNDKSGKPLYVGDIVSYHLSGMGSGGPVSLKITRNKKGVIRLSHPHDPNKGGMVLRKNYEPYLTLINTSRRQQ